MQVPSFLNKYNNYSRTIFLFLLLVLSVYFAYFAYFAYYKNHTNLMEGAVNLIQMLKNDDHMIVNAFLLSKINEQIASPIQQSPDNLVVLKNTASDLQKALDAINDLNNPYSGGIRPG